MSINRDRGSMFSLWDDWTVKKPQLKLAGEEKKKKKKFPTYRSYRTAICTCQSILPAFYRPLLSTRQSNSRDVKRWPLSTGNKLPKQEEKTPYQSDVFPASAESYNPPRGRAVNQNAGRWRLGWCAVPCSIKVWSSSIAEENQISPIQD